MSSKVARVCLREKLDVIGQFWAPKIVGAMNGQHVKLAKLKGEFVWHRHDAEDELFLVIKGKLIIRLEGQDIELNEGEMTIIPKGVLHLPVAEEEVHVLLFEPATTLNTGNIHNDRSVEAEWI